MTLHKRGGAQSCLDYRHGVSSYCAGLNALAGSRVACAWMAARRLLLPHCYATITMPYWNENEYQISRPGNQTKGRGSYAGGSLSMSPHCLSPGESSSRPANP